MPLLSSDPRASARDDKRTSLPAARLVGLGTAVPALRVSQKDVLDFIQRRFHISDRTRALYEKTLGNHAIAFRHFALDALEEILELDHDRVNDRFQRAAVTLAARALARALENAGVAPAQIDYLAVATCTGYLCPGLAPYLIEACGLRADVRFGDLVGMGCGAAIPALEHAANFARTNPGALTAVVCVEICSAAMVSNDDVDIVISNSIFSDGAAAVLLRADDGNEIPAAPRLDGFASITIPKWRETLRFRSEKGHLRNVLGKEVPAQSATAMANVAEHLFPAGAQKTETPDHWLVHAGGEKILNAISKRLVLPAEALASSRSILQEHGNMSSPTVLFVLEEELRARPPRAGETGLLVSFGAGFSAHGVRLSF